jgi:S1-C subfamily serine protease
MRTTWTAYLTLLGAVTLLLATGCPPPPKPEPQGKLETGDRPSGKAAPGKQITSMELPKSMVIGKNVTLSGFYEDEALPEEGGGGAMGDRPNQGGVGERPSQMGKGGAQTQNLYKIVAPATVIVRSERGYGTGVVYDPAGWILTNHHVVAHAKREDFRWVVNVGVGKLTKGGVMEKQKTYKGVVHKIAPLLDIAVVKLINPPKRLVSIRISDKDPVPGQHVTSLGHAGIGLLWAIKDGQIAAIGKLSKHLAQLQLYESSKDKDKPKEGAGGASAERLAKMKAKRLEALRKYLEKKVPALVIQSTCDISQGDSGGPLVNDRAEIVGLNAFVRSGGRSRKESNFHIHAAELRKFIKEVPKEAPQLLPDPYNDGGSLAKLGDADLDSTVDVMAMYKVLRRRFFRRKRAMAYFLDLDQDSFKGQSTVPEVKDVVEKRSFDAEMVFLSHGGYLHAWYDTNNDRKHDVLLVAPDRFRARNKVTAFRIDAAGKLTKDEALAAGTLIRPKLFKDQAMAQRLLKVSGKIFSHRLLPPGARGAKPYPDPIGSAGHAGKLKDNDRDGKPDTVDARGLFSSGYVFDVDQNSLGKFKAGDTLHQVRQAGAIDAEFSWINIKRTHWAWYDTNNDGAFDLLLKGGRYPGNIVSAAWRVGADKKYVMDKDQVGRLMVQPELLQGAGQAASLRKMVKRVLMSSRVAAGPGVKAFPDPNDYYRFGYQLKSIKRFKEAAVTVRKASRCTATLVDVDLDTKRKAKKAKKTVIDLVKEKAFDAEFAEVKCRYDAWSFYDTRGKGRYDLVLYSSRKGKGKPTAAYRIDKKGAIVALKKPVACDGLVIPGLFKNRKLKRNFSKMAGALFTVPDIRCKP